MSVHKIIIQHFQRSPVTCAAIYFGLILGLLIACGLSVANLQDRRASLAAATETFEQLQSRLLPSHSGIDPTTGVARGSPFLEGQTVTIAGARLLQRISGAIATVGGRILSSQVDLQTTKSKPGFISVTINCELDQPGLQKLLFDLEAGMPFLFVDQLEVRSSGRSSASPSPHMQVLLSASGQWLGKQ